MASFSVSRLSYCLHFHFDPPVLQADRHNVDIVHFVHCGGIVVERGHSPKNQHRSLDSVEQWEFLLSSLGKGFSNCSQWESSNENWLPARGLFVPRKQNEARKRLWYIYVFLAVYRNEMNFVLTLAEVEAADKRYPATP